MKKFTFLLLLVFSSSYLYAAADVELEADDYARVEFNNVSDYSIAITFSSVNEDGSLNGMFASEKIEIKVGQNIPIQFPKDSLWSFSFSTEPDSESKTLNLELTIDSLQNAGKGFVYLIGGIHQYSLKSESTGFSFILPDKEKTKTAITSLKDAVLGRSDDLARHQNPLLGALDVIDGTSHLLKAFAGFSTLVRASQINFEFNPHMFDHNQDVIGLRLLIENKKSYWRSGVQISSFPIRTHPRKMTRLRDIRAI